MACAVKSTRSCASERVACSSRAPAIYILLLSVQVHGSKSQTTGVEKSTDMIAFASQVLFFSFLFLAICWVLILFSTLMRVTCNNGRRMIEYSTHAWEKTRLKKFLYLRKIKISLWRNIIWENTVARVPALRPDSPYLKKSYSAGRWKRNRRIKARHTINVSAFNLVIA